LYLIHVPFAVPYQEGPFAKDDSGNIIFCDTNHVETWKEFERCQSAGLIKHLGISNFNKAQIQRLLDNSVFKPEVLQVEMHVYLQQKELVAFCKANNILVTAYSPLGSKGIEKMMPNSTRKFPDLMENSVVVEIASRLGKTPAQILIRYLIELGVSTIPKSTNSSRLKSNMDVFGFELSGSDKAALAGLEANVHICDFAFFPGIERHPEFPFAQDKH